MPVDVWPKAKAGFAGSLFDDEVEKETPTALGHLSPPLLTLSALVPTLDAPKVNAGFDSVDVGAEDEPNVNAGFDSTVFELSFCAFVTTDVFAADSEVDFDPKVNGAEDTTSLADAVGPALESLSLVAALNENEIDELAPKVDAFKLAPSPD